MALAVDASTPTKTTVAITVTSTTTASFSPVANSVIYLFIAVNGAGNSTQSISSVTDSLGAPLAWTQLVVDNVSSASFGGATAIWYAPCPSAQSGMTVTVNYAISTGASAASAGIIKTVVFTGAAMRQAGNTAIRNSTATGTPSMALTTQFDNSWVFGALQNFTNSTSPTAGGSQTNTINGDSSIVTNATSGDGWWVQSQSATTTAQGTSVTINDTAPTTILHHFAMVEVMAQQPLPQNYQFVKAGDGMSASEKIR